jgi:hypothetical protein
MNFTQFKEEIRKENKRIDALDNEIDSLIDEQGQLRSKQHKIAATLDKTTVDYAHTLADLPVDTTYRLKDGRYMSVVRIEFSSFDATHSKTISDVKSNIKYVCKIQGERGFNRFTLSRLNKAVTAGEMVKCKEKPKNYGTLSAPVIRIVELTGKKQQNWQQYLLVVNNQRAYKCTGLSKDFGQSVSPEHPAKLRRKSADWCVQTSNSNLEYEVNNVELIEDEQEIVIHLL